MVIVETFQRDYSYKRHSFVRDIWRSTKPTDQYSPDLHRCHEEIYSTSTRPEDGQWKIPFIFGHISQTVLQIRRTRTIDMFYTYVLSLTMRNFAIPNWHDSKIWLQYLLKQ